MKKFFLPFIFTLIFFITPLHAQSPLYFKSSADVAENFPQSAEAGEFARAAFIASGCHADEAALLLGRLENFCADLKPELSESLSDEEKCEKILFFIYENILFKYSLYQTLFDEALKNGVYNCVSSALLFMYFAKNAGIQVTAVETPRHAFCTVYPLTPGQKKFDVETTNPYGVNPGKKRTENLGRGLTAYTVVPAKNYNGRHEVDDRRAVAMIYNNRISDLQRNKDNAATIQLAVDAAEIQDKSRESLDTLALCVVNCAVDLSAKGRQQEGIELVSEAREQFGANRKYSEYLTSTWHNLLLAKIKSDSLDGSLSEIEAQKENLLPADYSGLKEFAYIWNAEKAAAARDWKKAVSVDDEGILALGENKNLIRQKNSYVHNYAADFYNEAARLYNSGNKAAAVAVIQKGLEELPENKILLQALNQMK